MQKLYRYQGALPFFGAVFLNAFIDLGHKIVIQNTVFKTYDGSTQVILIAIVNGLILLPFILLFSPAGFASDKYPKSQVMQLAAWSSVILTGFITLFYYLGLFWPAFAMTFLLAVQSAFYSPAKYGYIKVLFGKNRLAEGNGAVQAISIVAILAGTLVYSSLFEWWFPTGTQSTQATVAAIAPLGWLLMANSVLQLIMVYRLPALEQHHPDEHFPMRDFLRGRQTKKDLQPLARRPVIRLSVIGMAMFWSIGQVMLAVFPAFAKETLFVTNTVIIQGTLAASGLGIALGAFVAGKISRNHIETALIPIGATGIALGLWLITLLPSPAFHAVNYLFVGFMGGLFIVPLNALIQFHAGEHELGRILAASNWVQNMAMLSFLIITALVATLGLQSRYMLLLIAAASVIGGGFIVWHMPQSLLRFQVYRLLKKPYQLQVGGLKQLPSTGAVVLTSNARNWLDCALIQIACPRRIRFFRGEPGPGGDRRGVITTGVVDYWLEQGEVVCLLTSASHPGGPALPVVVNRQRLPHKGARWRFSVHFGQEATTDSPADA